MFGGILRAAEDIGPYKDAQMDIWRGIKNGTASAQKTRKSVPYGGSMILYRRGGVCPPVTSRRPVIILACQALYFPF